MSSEHGTGAVGTFSGHHVLAELYGVAGHVLDDADLLRETLTRTLAEAGATVCDVVANRFEPQGVTVVAMLAESHASMHTYPELGATFVDVFTCGQQADPEKAVLLLAAALGADPPVMSTVRRGRQPASTGK